ncbi:GyrI-like domain-containing protein [Qiania dongpingensis]|uniref:GyrI-like domain-containing protein n=1 Tax=Qiania dongpingensis TaxID=2763669 RepID=A0A7G9G791_9FIRM|nr:GyrI-like domain-containing protein [Qiania dongpingensis]QNM06673.1 GyrI-like domain-containing protein [Qiania dongpingensis]
METPFRIEERDSFRVIGYAVRTTNRKKEGRKTIPLQWAEFHNGNQKDTLLPLMDREPYGLFGISIYNTDEEDSRTFIHFIAVSSGKEITGDLEEYMVPAMTWAVFPCTIETIGKTEAQAITKWLPRSGYRPLNSGYLTGRMKSGAPDIEYYGEDGLAEVWIGVKKKQA